MNTIKNYILSLLLLFGTSAMAQTNVLRIGDVTYPAGRTAAIPIALENQSDIVGVQFEILTPYELKAFEDESLVSLNKSRAIDYQASVTSKSNQSYQGKTYRHYRVILYSPTNTTISGSSGTLLTLQLDLPDNLENGTELPVAFYEYKSSTYTSTRAEVILTDRSGSNVVSGFTGGTITVEVVPRPDLVPTDVAVSHWPAQATNSTSHGASPTRATLSPAQDGQRKSSLRTSRRRRASMSAPLPMRASWP